MLAATVGIFFPLQAMYYQRFLLCVSILVHIKKRNKH